MATEQHVALSGNVAVAADLIMRKTPSERSGWPEATRIREGRKVLDLERYIPFYLSVVNNIFFRQASGHFIARFGIGIIEWKIVGLLAVEPSITATRICEVTGMDKGATSRALSRLHMANLAIFDEVTDDARKKCWRLNEAGLALHDRILDEALEREAILLAGLSADDLGHLLRIVKIMKKNVQKLQGGE